jgi:N-acetylglucosamine-6-phosphate deacetylase
MTRQALLARQTLTPEGFQPGLCVLIERGRIAAVLPAEDCPRDAERIDLDGDLLPGFIDLQVNGGGGILFNDLPTVEGIAAIAEAHRRFGTTGFLPTLISDDLDVVARAIAAVDEAIAKEMPGILGIHIEGPFLNPARSGIHDSSKFRALDDDSIDLLCSAKRGRTLVTLAPERAPPGAVRALADRGIIVAAGHSDATTEEIEAALEQGLAGFTHLYNAMSQLGSRAPGVVGAALADRDSWCSIIVDGHHVHPVALQVALAAKGADKLVLVTDAMPNVGSSGGSFTVGGTTITAHDGRLAGPDGTLAGSDLDMNRAVLNAERLLGIDFATAVRMASQSPARALGVEKERGAIRTGLAADLVLVDAERQVVETWIAGEASA